MGASYVILRNGCDIDRILRLFSCIDRSRLPARIEGGTRRRGGIAWCIGGRHAAATLTRLPGRGRAAHRRCDMSRGGGRGMRHWHCPGRRACGGRGQCSRSGQQQAGDRCAKNKGFHEYSPLSSKRSDTPALLGNGGPIVRHTGVNRGSGAQCMPFDHRRIAPLNPKYLLNCSFSEKKAKQIFSNIL